MAAERDLAQRLAYNAQRAQIRARWRAIRERNNIAAAFEATLRGDH